MSKTKIIITSLALGISLLLLPGQSYADTYYTVKKGDTLWKISQAFNTTTGKIQSLNNMNSFTINPGQNLLIADGADAGGVVAPVNQLSESTSRIGMSAGNYYIVRYGDTPKLLTLQSIKFKQ